MKFFLFTLAIGLMLLGHVFKVRRWAQFVEVYEQPVVPRLLNSIAVGHTLNFLLPFRIGDIVRIIFSGRKMNNGYALAIATVCVDLYLDIITVGVLFFTFAIAGIGPSDLIQTARTYTVIFFIVICITFVFVGFRKIIKIAIQKITSIFNKRIELRLMYLSWAVISSLKNIPQKLHKGKLALNTAVIWAAYLLSYLCFAQAATLFGMNISMYSVFTLLFSNNCFSAIFGKGVESAFNGFPLLLLIYMMTPLLLILLYVFIRLRVKSSQHKAKAIKQDVNYLLPQLNEKDRLTFLQAYFSNEDPESLRNYLKINSDIYIVQDLTSGSNAVTLLCLWDNKNFYRKYAFGKDGEKLKAQLDWLKAHQGVLQLTEIVGENVTEDYCCYDMAYDSKAIGLFQYIHSVPTQTGCNMVKRVFTDLENTLFLCNRHPADRETLYRYIREKSTKNLERIKNAKGIIRQLSAYNTIIINGVEYDNLSRLEKWLAPERLFEIFSHDDCSDIHGDMTVENIICTTVNGLEDDYYIIDPNTGNVHDSRFLDYAKFLQSLHGHYEFLMKTSFVYVNENRVDYQSTVTSVYIDIFSYFRQFLKDHFSREQEKSIYYHEVIHWLRLMPYKIEKSGVRAALFYAGLIKIFNDVVNRFEE